MTREQKFYSALRDVFVGAKVEGESGYINLMRIKSRYYETGVFPKLEQDINAALRQFPAFRDELFEKLYDFFHRYFSESGSIYFRYTPLHQNVYEKVYTDDKDVMLFWKTHMLYYVKTDRLFKSMEVEVDGQKFFFDASTLEHKKANEKRDSVYSFKEKRKDTLVFTVAYSEKGKKTKTDDILKVLRKNGDKISEEILERAFRVFEKQSEVDYFINKDAKVFLEEQFNLWLYQYVFSGVSEWTQTRIKQLQTLKDIALKIIAFISQFENELVKIWSKPKFALNSNYVITLDRIAEKDIALVEKLLAHKTFKAQIEEWQKLGIVDESFKKTVVLGTEGKRRRLNQPYHHLPIDLKHFKDMEVEILSLFDNLDHELDGRVIQSENYQALKTISAKFIERIQCVYIDPPYNSPATEIMYENKYKSSSWLSLIRDRIQIARDFLGKAGVLCIAIDDNEFHHLTSLVQDYYPESLGVSVVRSNPAGRSAPKGFSLAHEYAVFVAKTEAGFVSRLQRTQEQIERYSQNDQSGHFEWVNFRKHGGLRSEAARMFYPIYVTTSNFRLPKMLWHEQRREWDILEEPRKGEHVILPVDENGQERRWKWSYERLANNLGEAKLDRDRHGEPAVYIKSRIGEEGIVPFSWWDKKEYSATDHGTRILKDLFGKHGVFSYPKSPYLVEDCLRVANLDRTDIALDFFAGSGTTAHATINLNREDEGKRKYVLIEMADYFESVLVPRIKKVIYSDKWKDGKAQNGQGVSHFMKYYTLEQYEGTLRCAKYGEADLFDDPNKDAYHQYVFLRDLKMLEALEVDLKKNKVKVELSKLYDGIDIAETLSNLTGKWIKRIAADSVEFDDGEVVDTKNLDWKRIKPLIWW
ncbi:MAG: site-specific DNA-methyltransferase [Deltaproteobacteria bacterium]|nr:site-specific DNA-methyltransferase [Deltaproteobacteria bacterium]